MECIICYENTTKTTPTIECGHKIHHKCLLKWKFMCNYNKETFRCPYCTQPIDNMRKTRSECKNNLKYLVRTAFPALFKKYYGEFPPPSPSFPPAFPPGNDRCKHIIEVFKLLNNNKNLLYRSEHLVNTVKYKVDELQKELQEATCSINKSIKRELNNELDKCRRNLEIYTLYTR